MSTILPLPLYLVFDTSGSAIRDGWIDHCNRTLPTIVEALERSGPRVLFSLGAWSPAFRILIPLSPVAGLSLLPMLAAEGSERMSVALHSLSAHIEGDLSQL